jgi:hypothetical protein
MNPAIIDNIGGFTMIISGFVVIAWIINAAFNFSLKRRMLQKEKIDDNMLQLFAKPVESLLGNIKWGLLLFSGGIGLVLLEFLPFSGETSPLPYGVEAVCLGAGFLAYYFIARSIRSRS